MENEKRELYGKVAMVTASTRGIGLACAKKLAEEGAKVYFAVRRREAGLALVEELASRGLKAGVCLFDAALPDTFRTSVQEVQKQEGRLDILVNNYGYTDPVKDLDLLQTEKEDFLRIVETNLASVYAACQQAVQIMGEQGGGSIVNIASVGGRYPDVSRTAYGVAKASILFLTKEIAVQYAAKKVRANCILPGFIETEASKGNMSPAFLATFLKTVPLGRPGTPEDVAEACLFLAGERASFLTGEEIAVSGGFGVPSPMYSLYSELGRMG